MIVHCTSCSTGYLLPDHLLGPGGARVRCPKCNQSFAVELHQGAGVATSDATAAAGAGSTPGMAPAPGDGSAPSAGSAAVDPAEEAAERAALESAERVAGELLSALADQVGARLDAARARGRVLAEFGPDLMRAYDAYRRRLGLAAPPAAFRNALRDRWGVDLIAGVES